MPDTADTGTLAIRAVLDATRAAILRRSLLEEDTEMWSHSGSFGSSRPRQFGSRGVLSCAALLAAHALASLPGLACVGQSGELPPPGVRPVVIRPPERLYRWPGDLVPEGFRPSRSTEPLLIILYKFSDTSSPRGTTTVNQWMLHGFHSALSLQDYFDEVSYGFLTINKASESHGTANDGVAGWYTASKSWNEYQFYGGGGPDLVKIAKDAVTAADAHVNFASFDADQSGSLSTTELHILVVAAAHEASYDNAPSPKVWRTNLSVSALLDGVTVGGAADFGSVAIVGELTPSGEIASFGLAAHEIGHQLGWPDLYDTDRSCTNGYVKNSGLGEWDLMSGGDWNGSPGGNRPAHPCAWLKAFRGWTIPVEVTEDVSGVTIQPAAQNAVCYKLWTNGTYGGAYPEYFLVENRQKIGTTYDSSIPGEGLLIYHVDENVKSLDADGYGSNNWDDNQLQWDFARQFIDLECADGYTRNNNGSACTLPCEQCPKDDLDVTVKSTDTGTDCSFGVTFDNRGDGGNPYPGATSNTTFDPNSCPSSESNSGSATEVGVKNISVSGDNILADFDVEVPVPPYPDVWVLDCDDDVGSEPATADCPSWWRSPSIWIDNDNDGIQDRPLEGEKNRFWIRIQNRGGGPAANVTVKFYRRTNAVGLSFPSGADLLGERLVGLVPVANPVVIFMDATVPTPPVDGSHYCFGVTLNCEIDPLPVDAGVANTNNKACVNILVLKQRAGEPGFDREPMRSVFLAGTPEDDTNPGPGNHRIEMDVRLSPGSAAYLEWIAPEGEQGWEAYPGDWAGQNHFVGIPFPLNGTPEDTILFRVNVDVPGDAPHGEVGEVSVQQIFLGGAALIQTEPLFPDKPDPAPAGAPASPGPPGGRMPGDTIEEAWEVPYCDGHSVWGTTVGYADDYGESCPPGRERGAPDVVYAYSPAQAELMTIDLCQSNFDTMIYVYENAYTPGSPIACNDDHPGCGGMNPFGSRIENLYLQGGNRYYIVIDGYGNAAGTYEMALSCSEGIPPLGGMGYPVHLDGYRPRAIEDLVAEVANSEGEEWPLELAVRLTWTPVSQDSAGNREHIRRYWIYRSTEPAFDPDTCGVFFRSIFDKDPSTPGWQFTDSQLQGDHPLQPGLTYYYQVIAEDWVGWRADPSNEAESTPYPLLDHADHDVGGCVLTVTDRGILGFMDATQAEGSGLIYPPEGMNLLYIGSLWVGRSAAYVANRDYDADPRREWVVDAEPDGHVWIDENGLSDQDIHSGFTDAGAAGSLGLHVRQESWAFADPEAMTDFVVVRYQIQNRGGGGLTDLYAGVFLDLDMDPYEENQGAADPEEGIAYIHGPAGIHAGAGRLENPVDPIPLANATLVDNEAFVWNQAYVLDADKFAFLAASDPQHVLHQSPEPRDYGLLLSAGPFSLAAGQTREVAFAILCGGSPEDLREALDVARAAYPRGPSGAPSEGEEERLATRILPAAPNPMRGATTIRFDLGHRGRAAVEIYDVAGRHVVSLVSEDLPAGRFALPWDGRDSADRRVASGIYFVKLATASFEQSSRLLVLR